VSSTRSRSSAPSPGGRETAAPATRERILEQAWAQAREHGIGSVTLADVARAAGVSRQAVYLHFGSRAGLLVAMTRHHDHSSGFAERAARIGGAPEPADDLAELIRAWCAYLPDILPVARALSAASTEDQDASSAWQDRMRALRSEFERVLAPLAVAGRLAPGWSTAEAAAWAWAAVHPDQWHHLVAECGWSPVTFTDRCVAAISAVILQPAAARPVPPQE
jgi:AcrR family transcriptional regulator